MKKKMRFSNKVEGRTLSGSSGEAGNEREERRQRRASLRPFPQAQGHHYCGGGAPSSIPPSITCGWLSGRHELGLLAQAGGIREVAGGISPLRIIFWYK